MTATRLSAASRRASIISAARGVFARYGLEGTRTQQIARAAGVSEALVFRHFPTKTHIYRAVLRDVIADQNRAFRSTPAADPSTQGLLTMIDGLITHAMKGHAAHNAEGMRMVVGSLAGDGHYARLVYRRALRLSEPGLIRALEAAKADGGIAGALITPANASALLEHVGTMIMMARCHAPSVVPYASGDERLRTEAILFCARGLGIAEERINAYLRYASAAG
jgi:AcrR family transcriptional regulator